MNSDSDDQKDFVLLMLNQAHIRQILEGDSSIEPLSTRQRAIERIDFLASLIKAEKEREKTLRPAASLLRRQKKSLIP